MSSCALTRASCVAAAPKDRGAPRGVPLAADPGVDGGAGVGSPPKDDPRRADDRGLDGAGLPRGDSAGNAPTTSPP